MLHGGWLCHHPLAFENLVTDASLTPNDLWGLIIGHFKGSSDPEFRSSILCVMIEISSWIISRSTQNYLKMTSFNFRVGLCRIRLFPRLISKVKRTPLWTTLKNFWNFWSKVIYRVFPDKIVFSGRFFIKLESIQRFVGNIAMMVKSSYLGCVRWKLFLPKKKSNFTKKQFSP